MKLNKRQAFLTVVAVVAGISLLYQSVWVFSRAVTAEVYAADPVWRGTFGFRYKFSYMYATYQVGDVVYHGSYFRDEQDVANRQCKVRYLIFSPGVSRKDSFAGNWAYSLLLIGVVTLIASIVFIRKDIIADQAVVVIQGKVPFVRLENNSIEDYNQHTIETGPSDEAEQALRGRLRIEADLFKRSEVNASVYKLNPVAIAIFVGYLFPFFWFFQILLTEKSVGAGIILLGAFLVFVPLFVQNTNNPTFAAKIPDEGSLVFSDRGIQYKEGFYPLGDIEAAVVYLESFRGFTYKEHVTVGNATLVSAGDNNKISFKYRGEVTDLTFILGDLSDYWSLKNLIAGWSASGVNVLLTKVFEDDFLIQEMVKYQKVGSC